MFKRDNCFKNVIIFILYFLEFGLLSSWETKSFDLADHHRFLLKDNKFKLPTFNSQKIIPVKQLYFYTCVLFLHNVLV